VGKSAVAQPGYDVGGRDASADVVNHDDLGGEAVERGLGACDGGGGADHEQPAGFDIASHLVSVEVTGTGQDGEARVLRQVVALRPDARGSDKHDVGKGADGPEDRSVSPVRERVRSAIAPRGTPVHAGDEVEAQPLGPGWSVQRRESL